MCQLVLPGMRARGAGRIVNMSSMGANFMFPGAGAYHASKYAVEALSDALRFEVKGFGVGVTVIQPGAIRTEFAGRSAAGMPEGEGPYAAFNAEVGRATKDAYEKGPLARLGGEPDAVAKAVEKAIIARRAPIRTRVTASAHVLVTQRRLLPDRGWDAFVCDAVQAPRLLSVILYHKACRSPSGTGITRGAVR